MDGCGSRHEVGLDKRDLLLPRVAILGDEVGVVGGGGFWLMHEVHQTSYPEEWRKEEVGFRFHPI